MSAVLVVDGRCDSLIAEIRRLAATQGDEVLVLDPERRIFPPEETMMPAVAVALVAAVDSAAVDSAPAAIVRHAGRRQASPAFLRNMMVVQTLALDTSRASRRARAAISRSRSDRLAEPPSARNGSLNWLKMAINSQR